MCYEHVTRMCNQLFKYWHWNPCAMAVVAIFVAQTHVRGALTRRDQMLPESLHSLHDNDTVSCVGCSSSLDNGMQHNDTVSGPAGSPMQRLTPDWLRKCYLVLFTIPFSGYLMELREKHCRTSSTLLNINFIRCHKVSNWCPIRYRNSGVDILHSS